LAGEDLGRRVRRLDPDRWLASRFIANGAKRADVIALLAFDAELARAPRIASDPLIAEIRLTWWREAVDEIFEGPTHRRHPVVIALARAIARHGLERERLEAMIEARIEGPAEPAAWANATAGSLAVLTATILDPAAQAEPARLAGRAWGLFTLRRASVEPGALDAPLAAGLEVATQAARGYSPAAFPAIACATLIGPQLRHGRMGELEKRLRLLAAVARGRI
jgi:phytoene synthase